MTASDDDRRYKNRRASAAVWPTLAEVLLEAEIGVVKDTDQFMIGDGVNVTDDLPVYESSATILAAAALLFFRPYATVDRPDPADASTYYDTTLFIPAWSDGTDWRDSTGTVI